MYESKYNKLLTIFLIIVIIAIIVLLCCLGYRYYKDNSISTNGSDFANSLRNEISNNIDNTNTDNSIENIPQENTAELNEILSQLQGTNTNSSGSTSSSGTSKKKTYQGYEVFGKIEIPATKLNCPILEYSTTSITIGVGKLYGASPNEIGNMCLASHNYRNGKLFSNNKKLSVGDVIYITDLSGNRVKYTIYKKYETTPEDAEYMSRDTAGAREISLSTCTDNSKARLIIWAKAD